MNLSINYYPKYAIINEKEIILPVNIVGEMQKMG